MELVVVIAGIFLLYFLQVFAYRLYWDKGLCMQLHFQRVPAREGERVKLYETLTNRKRLPLPVFSVLLDLSRNGQTCLKDPEESGRMTGYAGKKLWFLNEILSLRGQEEKHRTIEIKGLKRGYYQISEAQIRTTNLFLTEWFSPGVSTDSSLYVYPRALSEEELTPLFEFLSDVSLTQRYSYEDDLELRGIREYQPYDPMKRVNWKASARQGNLQVNMMEYVANQEIMLLPVFDGEATEEDREYALTMTAGMAECCLEQGIPTGVLCNGEDFETEECLRIDARGGRAGREEILQGLSRIWFPRSPVDMISLLSRELDEKSGGDSCTYIVLDACAENDQAEQLAARCRRYGNACYIYRVKEHRQEGRWRQNRGAGVEW